MTQSSPCHGGARRVADRPYLIDDPMITFIGSAVGAPAKPFAARVRRGSRIDDFVRSPMSGERAPQ